MTKITATFRNGDTYTRTTEAAYTHASRSERRRVGFHTSERAARKAAGRYGTVVTTDYVAPVTEAPAGVPVCSVCGEGGSIMGVAGHPEVGKVHGRCVGKAIGR